MVDDLGHSDFCLWDSGHCLPCNIPCWNCNRTRLFDSGRRNCACNLCVSFSQIGGFLWHILLGPLYGIIALSLLANPLLGVVSLALLLTLFLLIEGVLELGLYFCIRRLQHSVDGIGTLILGILMVTKWRPYSPEIIAILIGISLMLSGLSRIMLSLAVRALTPA